MSVYKISTKLYSRRSFIILAYFTPVMIVFTVTFVLFPVLLVIRLLTWLIVVLIMIWKNWGTTYYGKLVSYREACMGERFLGEDVEVGGAPPPRMSIVTTMRLEGGGALTVKQLRKVFIRKVLKATLPGRQEGSRKKPRYPELQQYLSTLLGFQVWKQDPNFNISNHIVEQLVTTKKGGNKEGVEGKESDEITGEDADALDLSKIHQELLNKPYLKHRSPWEIVLVRLAKTTENCDAVLACRVHHTLGDSRSLLKLFVECLGQKPLKRSQRTTISDTSLIKRDSTLGFSCRNCCAVMQYYFLWPWRHLAHLIRTVSLLIRCARHPWKMVTYQRRRFSKNLMLWSEPLPLAEIQMVAMNNKVSEAAVIMGVCAGAVRRCQEDVLGKKDVAVGYQLDKPAHPNYLANRSYVGILQLPTGEVCPLKRLEKCHATLQRAKTAHLGKHLDLLGRAAATVIPYPIASYFTVNRFVPLQMCQIAGDQEGFCVGNDGHESEQYMYPCSDFRMSLGTHKGVSGVMLCASSYKESMTIGVIVNETVLEKRQIQMLVENIFLEFESLKLKNG